MASANDLSQMDLFNSHKKVIGMTPLAKVLGAMNVKHYRPLETIVGMTHLPVPDVQFILEGLVKNGQAKKTGNGYRLLRASRRK